MRTIRLDQGDSTPTSGRPSSDRHNFPSGASGSFPHALDALEADIIRHDSAQRETRAADRPGKYQAAPNDLPAAAPAQKRYGRAVERVAVAHQAVAYFLRRAQSGDGPYRLSADVATETRLRRLRRKARRPWGSEPQLLIQCQTRRDVGLSGPSS